ncbi:MAG: flagellar hook-basal body protein [Oscillospiraceae bacterium]|jgi:flagellar basal body rod protein FlgG|nr:flagellar hook-basal body protein [Oscillospiraceae bacterium]
MNIAFYNGASGLKAYQHGINAVAHNIANVNSYGYKADKAEFRDLMYTRMDVNPNYNGTREAGTELMNGHGVQLFGLDLQYTQGSFHNTGHPLDFAIAGEGLFAVNRRDRIEYTRNGDFDISVEPDGNYLVAADGAYVLDADYQRIQILYRDEYGPNGELTPTEEIDFDAIAERLGVFSFDNPFGLQKLDGQNFLPTDISGQPFPAFAIGEDGRVVRQYEIYTTSLERSNVSLSQEMSDLIVDQKAYQFSARVVSVADELEQVVNSLRRS